MSSACCSTGAGRNRALFVLAGAALAGALYTAWRAANRGSPGVGAHARLVPLDQARREATWTHEALRSK